MPGPPPDVLRKPGNRNCADCTSRDPRWASVNLGIFICETCAGIHRDLGTHISKVKSVKLDEWKPELVATARAIGNERSNAYYEHNVPDGVKYIGNVNSAGGDKIDEKEARKLKTWIRAKYDEKKYAPAGIDEPKERVARGESLDTPGAVEGGTAAAPEQPRSSKHRDKSSRKSKKDKGPAGGDGCAGDGWGLGGMTPEPDQAKATLDAAPSFAEAFAPLGDWASAQVDGRGAADGKTSRKSKKQSRDGSRKRSSSRAGTGSHAGDGGGLSKGQWGSETGMPQQQPMMMQQHQQEQEHYQSMMMQQEQQPQQQQQMGPFGGIAGSGCFSGPPATAHVVSQWEGSKGGCIGVVHGGVPAAVDVERRAALQTVAQLFAAPESVLGVTLGAGEGLLPLFGFDMQSAEFQPSALLKKRKQPGEAAMGFDPMRDPEDWIDESLGVGRLIGAKAGSASFPPTDVAEGARDALLNGALSRRVKPMFPEDAPEATKLKPMVKAAVGSELNQFQEELDKLRQEMRMLQKDYSQLKDEKESLATAMTAMREGGATPQGLHAAEPEGGAVPGGFPGVWEAAHRPGRHEDPNDWWNRASGPGQGSSLLSPAISSHSPFTPGPCGPIDAGPSACGGSRASSPSRSAHHAVPQWMIDREAFETFSQIFRQRDTEEDGYITGSQASNFFQQSGLEPLDLGVIWAMSDVNRDGRLNLEEFVCAMHLVDLRHRGIDVPPSIGPELWRTTVQLSRAAGRHGAEDPPAAAVADSPWEVSQEEAGRYCAIFATLDTNGYGSVGASEVQVALEATQLPTADLHQIWQLSDVDGDGRLTRGELACALHLVSRLAQGLRPPTQLPPELIEACRAVEAGRPVPAPKAISDGGGCRRERRPSEVGSATSGPCGMEEAASSTQGWRVDAQHMAQYRQIFDGTPRVSTDRLNAEEARDVMSKSGLPVEELSYIWRLSERDGDGCLVFHEFVTCMHLISRRRQGWDLPQELPPDLLLSLAGAEPAAAPAAPAVDALAAQAIVDAWGSRSTSPAVAQPSTPTQWAPGMKELEAYRAIFEASAEPTAAGGGPATMGIDAAKGVLERSKLPPDDLWHIWQLADVDGDGRLALGEFCCAMQLASHRRHGHDLPATLPAELAATVAASAVLAPAPSISSACEDASPWIVSVAEVAAYKALFDEVRQTGGVALDADEAREVLERSGLPHSELSHVWRLSDLDGDGRLVFSEFIVALHLAGRRREGRELPDELPRELSESAATASVAAGGATVPPAPLSPAVAPVALTAPRLPVADASDAARHGASEWEIDADTLLRYHEIFEGIERKDPESLSGSEAREFLERSQLPHTDLSHIWQLSDREGRGHLSLSEFSCAMHLVSRRLDGSALPSSLPLELVASSHQLPSFPASASDAVLAQTEATFNWRLTPDRIETYRALFASAQRQDVAFLGTEEARELLERSGLPNPDLAHVWSLADADGDGRLSLPEFVCAMHLVAMRRDGAELPPLLPPELSESAVSLLSHASSSSGTFGGFGAAEAPGTGMGWMPNRDELQGYRALFEGLDHRGVGRLGPDDVRDLLERSGVDPSESSSILQMSDVDEDGSLTLGEFSCAVHLLSCRRQGLPLPQALPPDLRQLAAARGDATSGL